MYLPFRIAIRYVFTKRTFNFISVITLISIIGIAIGVGALIAVISIFNGFRELTEKQISAIDPHIRISHKNEAWFKPPEELLNQIENIPDVDRFFLVKSGKIAIQKEDKIQVLNLVSVDKPIKHHPVSKHLYAGNILKNEESVNYLLLGGILADMTGIFPGDEVILFSPEMIESGIRTATHPGGVKATLDAIFITNIKDYDSYYAFCSPNIAERLFAGSINQISSIHLMLEDYRKSEKLMEKLGGWPGKGFRIESYKEINRELFEILNFERMIASVIFSIIILIAVFNVLASLTMTVIEKKKDISTLKAMGMKNRDISGLFLFAGLIIGVVASFSGGALGYSFYYLQKELKLFRFDTSSYIIDSLPVNIEIQNVILIVISSILITLISSLYPAFRGIKHSIPGGLRAE